MTDCFRRLITRFDRCYACPNTLKCGASGTSDYNTVVGKCSCYPGAVPNQCGTLGVCGLTGEGNMGATRLCASGPQSECTEDSQCVTGYCVKRFCNIGFAGTPDQGSKTPPNTFNSCTQGGPVYQCNAFSDGYESGGVCGAGDKCSAGRIETTPVELMISLHDYSQASINTRTGHCLEKTSESCPPPLPAERYSYLWNHVCRAGVESGLWESCKPCDTARWTWEGSLLPKFRAVQMCYQRDVVRPIMNAVADTVVALGLTNACAAAVNNSMGWTMFSSFVEGGQGDFKSQIGSRNACSGCQPMEMYEGIDGGLAFFHWHSRGNSIQSDCVGSPNTPGDMTNPDAGEFSFNDAKALWESVQPIGMAVQRGWTIAKGSVRTPYPTLTATPSPTPTP